VNIDVLIVLYISILLHILDNTFDRKRISANPALTLTLKHNNVFELTKWCHFSR